MKLDFRVLDKDVFESYMALEGWDSFPMLKKNITDGQMSFLLEHDKFCVYSLKGKENLLAAICIYKIIGDVLFIDFFEVNKSHKSQGIGSFAINELVLHEGIKKIQLDAKDEKAAAFWKNIGFVQVDNQTMEL